jgi:hypothetical protein
LTNLTKSVPSQNTKHPSKDASVATIEFVNFHQSLCFYEDIAPFCTARSSPEARRIHQIKLTRRVEPLPANMSRQIEQALLSMMPTYGSNLPPSLVELAGSLLAQSRHRASTLKAEEEVARQYACANIACDRFVKHHLLKPPAQYLLIPR